MADETPQEPRAARRSTGPPGPPRATRSAGSRASAGSGSRTSDPSGSEAGSKPPAADDATEPRKAPSRPRRRSSPGPAGVTPNGEPAPAPAPEGRQRGTVPLERRPRRAAHAQGRARVSEPTDGIQAELIDPRPEEPRGRHQAPPDVPAGPLFPRESMPTRLPLPGLAGRRSAPEPSVPVDHGHAWLDEEAGPLVRPYTMTGGRSRPVTSGLSLLTYVEALYAPQADLIHLQPEHRAILGITRTALSIAEVAGRLDLPVGVVKVLVGDLLQENLVSTFEADATVNPPDDGILQAVIDGLRAL